MPNEILLRGIVTEAPGEAISSEAIIPGMLVEINTATGLLRKHPTATGRSAKLFALAASWSAQGQTGTAGTPAINTPWPAGDTVVYHKAHAGQTINALLEPSHAAVAKGAWLESAGGGHLQAGTTNPIGVAAEAHAGTASTATRIKVDIV